MSKTWKVAHENPPATDLIWQDPSSYDPTRHGPPYLPSPKMARVAGVLESILAETGQEAVENALPAILVLLRAVAVVHQTNHWVSHGPMYYSDHQLFERLYGDMLSEIDEVAERAVGTGQGGKVADARSQMAGVHRIVALFYPEDTDGESGVMASFRSEVFLLECIQRFSESMKLQGTLTRGTDDLLAGIESKHEEHVYLLKQRIADEWKAV